MTNRKKEEKKGFYHITPIIQYTIRIFGVKYPIIFIQDKQLFFQDKHGYHHFLHGQAHLNHKLLVNDKTFEPDLNLKDNL